MAIRPLVDLSVSEAHALMSERVGAGDPPLPPLGAIENEDWGRDYLLARLAALEPETLAALGLSVEGDADE